MPTSPETWGKIKALFDAVLELDATERSFRLKDLCPDADLRAEVERLLAEHDQAATFLSTPALGNLTLDSEPPTTPPRFTEGDLLARRFRILRFIARGGMGEVYEAQDQELNERVAIKTIRSDILVQPNALARFKREVHLARKVTHPNVCRIFDLFRDNSTSGTAQEEIVFISMELLQGESLNTSLKTSGPMTVDQALPLIKQMASALAAAHSIGIVHRDFKPANIVLIAMPDQENAYRAVVTDFGLALRSAVSEETASLVTGPGLLGTPAYMSPEQIEGRPATPASDIYSFGLVIYEMVTGTRPFEGDTPTSAVLKRLSENPLPPRKFAPGISELWESVILRCLERQPVRRFQDTRELTRALETGDHFPPTNARHSWSYAGVAVVVLILLLGIVIVLNWRRSTPASSAEWEQITDFPDSAVQPSLSPDGHILTFIRGPETFVTAGQVYVKFLPDGPPVALTHDELKKLSPVFSPDGSQVAYTALENGWNTYEVPVTRGEPQLLLPNASGLTWISSRQFLFSEIRDGPHMGLVTAGPARVSERDLYFPSAREGMAHRSYVSPDRQWVVTAEMNLSSGWLRCRLLPLNGSSIGNSIGPEGDCTSAAWSPDGKWIYLTLAADHSSFHLWRVKFPGGPAQQITFGPTEEDGVAISPDGKSLITSVGPRQGTVWYHDDRGDRQISTEGFAYFPYINRDGTRLTYLLRDRRRHSGISVSDQKLDTKLIAVDLRTGTSQQIFSSPDVADYCITTGDEKLLYTVRDAQNWSHIWMVPVDHSLPPKQITSDETQDDNIACLDDGDVAFNRHENSLVLVYRMKPDGSALQKSFPTPFLSVEAFSPDGNWLAAWKRISDNDTRLMIYDLRDGTARQLCDSCGALWSPDGKRLYVSFASKSESTNGKQNYVLPWKTGSHLQALPPDGTRTEVDVAKIAAVVPAATQVEEFAPGASPNVYAFSRRTVQRNLYRVPLPQ